MVHLLRHDFIEQGTLLLFANLGAALADRLGKEGNERSSSDHGERGARVDEFRILAFVLKSAP